MAFGSASASGSASGSGTNGQTQSTSRAQVQIGNMPQLNNPYGSANGNFAMPALPANALPGNVQQLLNQAMANPAAIQPVVMEQGAANPGAANGRAVATTNIGEDKVKTGVDDQYSTVIKVKPNGQIHMIVINLTNMEIRRVQAANAEELRKKDKLAFTEYQKYLEAE